MSNSSAGDIDRGSKPDSGTGHSHASNSFRLSPSGHQVLDGVPDLDLLVYLPQLLEGLMNMLSDPSREIKVAAANSLAVRGRRDGQGGWDKWQCRTLIDGSGNIPLTGTKRDLGTSIHISPSVFRALVSSLSNILTGVPQRDPVHPDG